jgi:hypothetical protein
MKNPPGVDRRAVSSATGQKDSRYRDFYSGHIVNVNRLPERNRYMHTEWSPPGVNRRAVSFYALHNRQSFDRLRQRKPDELCRATAVVTDFDHPGRQSGAS